MELTDLRGGLIGHVRSLNTQSLENWPSGTAVLGSVGTLHSSP